ncbi:MAG: hypothetical protein J3K34DRAFT_523904 [Monoraphidium minutum]|nr:MAG: hypothetical protein J3K34DRAFT_523904 [Monoraphidium minutum]
MAPRAATLAAALALLTWTVAALAAPAGAPVRKLMTYTWDPPAPPMPSLPCARTALPDVSGYAALFEALWVNPKTREAAAAQTGGQLHPFKTFAAAWNSIPKFTQRSTGLVIYLMPGVSGSGVDSFWMEGGWGTAAAPIVVTRAPGATGPVSDLQSINVLNCTYLYFKSVAFIQPRGSGSGGDLVHFAACDFIYLLGATLKGLPGRRAPQETLKVNQVKGMYVEDTTITNGGDNTLDFVAVQYGHICRSTFINAQWGIYVKGGSAYIVIDSNVIDNKGMRGSESGLRVGQGTGFEYMVAPWLNYEAYSIMVVNNVVRNVYGAGLGVAGGYDILVAYNSVYNCGQRSHMAEFLFGSRSCDGDGDLPGRCTANGAAGGWGPNNGGAEAQCIPNKNVYFLNNLLVNRANKGSASAHFMAPAECTSETPGGPPAGVVGASVSDNLVVAGNVIINTRKRATLELGLDACTAANPTCTLDGVASGNTLNPPGLTSAMLQSTSALTIKAASKGALRAAWRPAPVPAFPAWATPLPVPAGPLGPAVTFDAAGAARGGGDMPGALL